MRKKLGEILVAHGAVNVGDVDVALADQSAGEPSRLGDLLVATGKISSTQLARGLAEQYELPYIDLPPLPQAVLELVGLEMQRQYRFVPIKSDGTELHIAMADLGNVEVVALLEQQWTKVHVHVSGGEEIDALHNTLSGIFHLPPSETLPSVAPSISPLDGDDDLFGSLDLTEDPPVQASSSPVPFIPPVAPEPAPEPAVTPPRSAPVASAPPRVEDLFGDLNLDSARTGITAQPPASEAMELSSRIEIDSDAPLIKGDAIEGPTIEGAPLEPADTAVERIAEPAEMAAVSASEEASGPVLGLKEGTGPLLDLVMEVSGGTGPVVDTPFFRDASVASVAATALFPAFQPSSPSAIGSIAIPPPNPTAPNPPFQIPPKTTAPSIPVVAGEPLPDWLKTDPGSPPAQLPVATAPPVPEPVAVVWTGALDHLAPSKLVLGVTRVLLSKGLVTEAEILAALGQKK